jgi:preprotein translocase subunit SecF
MPSWYAALGLAHAAPHDTSYLSQVLDAPYVFFLYQLKFSIPCLWAALHDLIHCMQPFFLCISVLSSIKVG